MNEFDEFAKWCANTATEIEKWPDRLEKEAFKQMREKDLTIGQTKRIIKDQEPPLPGEYHGTTPESFRQLVRQIVEDSYQKANQKINDFRLAEDGQK